MKAALLLSLAAVLVVACNGNGQANGSSNGGGPGGSCSEGDVPTLDIPQPDRKTESDMSYFREAKLIYQKGSDVAWEEKKEEILQTKGRAGQEFLIVLFALNEQSPERSIERQERGHAQLVHTIQRIAETDDDWGLKYFVIGYFLSPEAGPTFYNTVWLPTVVLAGKRVFPYVLAIVVRADLKDMQRVTAYRALGAAGRDEAIPCLRKLFAEHAGADGALFRAAVVQGFGETRTAEAIPDISRALDDSDPLVVEYAVRAALEINDVKATGLLVKALQRAKKVKEKRNVVERLQQVTGEKSIGENPAAWAEWWRSNGGRAE